MKGKLRLKIGLLLVLSVLLLLPSVPVKAQAANTQSITAKLDVLRPIMDGKYWNANLSPSDLISAVDDGRINAKDFGITGRGCASKDRPICTSNTFKYGTEWTAWQCNGFSKFIAYYLFGSDGDVELWTKYTGTSIKDTTFSPGDRIGWNGHHAIVWKVENNYVYVAECWGTKSDSHMGCQINFGYYNGGGVKNGGTKYSTRTLDELYSALSKLPGGYIQKAPTISLSGIYTLSPACAPNSCLDVADWGSDNETNIQLWEKTGSDNQLFELVPQTDGSYKIVSVYAKKPLDVYRGEALDEQNVQIYGDNGADAANQKWWLEEYEDGYYTITSALSDSMRLDVSAGLEENGTNIQIYTANDSEAQRWKLTFVRGLPPTISLSGQTIPGQLKVGQSFGLRGTVTASGGKLKEVYGAIVDANGNTVQSKTYSMDSATNNLRYSVNQDLIFNKLPEGTYKYYLSAVASNSYGEAKEVLLNATFTVGSGSSSSSSSWASSSSSSSSGSSGSTPTPTQPPVKKETKKPTVTISGQTVPSTQKQGSNFGIRGTVSTDCGKLTWLYGYITDRNGNVLQSGEYFPNSSSDNLRYSINNDLIFDRLSAGSYIYWVKATARNGDQETTETLIYTEFQVVSDAPAATQPPETTPAPTTPAAPAAPNISISEQTIPGSQRVGRNFGIRGIVTTDCGQITRVYGAILDSNGNTLQSGTYYPDSSSVNLRYNINNDLIFDNLSAGNYTYYVEVTANNGGTEKTQVLINAGFTES